VVRPLMIENLLAGTFFFYGFYSLQPYLLDVLGQRLVWVAAGVTAVGSLAGIVGNSIAPRLTRGEAWHHRPAMMMAIMGGVAAVGTFGAGIFGVLSPASHGVGPVLVLAGFWLLISFGNGVFQPLRRTLLNEHIPSAERATVLSMDAMFEEAGAAAGQPVLGWLSQSVSIPAGWIVGGVMILAGLPFLRKADRALD
jgi:MFS family permease